MKKINFKKQASKLLFKAKKQARNPFGSSETVKRNAAKMSKKMTSPEKALKKILQELNVGFEPQKVVGKKIYDFYVPSFNLLIEVHGTYWHADPRKYSADEMNKTQKKNVKNDIFKESTAKAYGYKIEVVWEDDLKNDYSAVKKRIKNILGI